MSTDLVVSSDGELPFMPTEQQLIAADHLAAGYSRAQSARKSGVPYRTLYKWMAKQEFMDFVMERRDELMRAQRPLFESTVARAQEIVFDALTGNIDIDEDIVELARQILERTVFRAVTAGFDPGDGGRREYEES